ncbi:MAG: N-acetylneuraminate synthase family protein [Candidatus Latescibacterota bacterium]|nr:MAG: N-acetylneuraminate synthase family protein [Candidatus Latescibacterota bacterium]
MKERKIIAEIGINHNGSIESAKTMALIAKEAGADFVKLQKRDISSCYSIEELREPCKSPWGSTVEAKVRGRELSWDEVSDFARFCEKNEIGWSASCFDAKSFKELQSYEPAFNKVPSGLAIHRDYLQMVAKAKRLTLISTGLLGSMDEIISAAEIFEDAGCEYVINHCVALYPCPEERLNLRVIPRLIDTFLYGDMAHCSAIGYSGHEVGILPTVIAAQFGAIWIERHFTLDRAWYGADQSASLEPQGLHRLVRDIRSLSLLQGDSLKLKGDEKIPVSWKP